MKITKTEYFKLTNILADISAAASLITMGAHDARDKMFSKIDDLNKFIETADRIADEAIFNCE